MERLLHRVVSILCWAAVAFLGAFGIYFTFANYPAFGIAVVLAFVLGVAYAERRRQRRAQRHRPST